MTKGDDIVSEAIAWWRGHRPLSFTEREHLANATVNVPHHGHALELAIAAHFQDNMERDKT